MVNMIEQLVERVSFVQADTLWADAQAEAVLSPFFAVLMVAFADDTQAWYGDYIDKTRTVAALARQTGEDAPALAMFWDNAFHVELLHALQNHTQVNAHTLRTVLPLATHSAYEALSAKARRSGVSVQALALAEKNNAQHALPSWLIHAVPYLKTAITAAGADLGMVVAAETGAETSAMANAATGRMVQPVSNDMVLDLDALDAFLAKSADGVVDEPAAIDSAVDGDIDYAIDSTIDTVTADTALPTLHFDVSDAVPPVLADVTDVVTADAVADVTELAVLDVGASVAGDALGVDSLNAAGLNAADLRVDDLSLAGMDTDGLSTDSLGADGLGTDSLGVAAWADEPLDLSVFDDSHATTVDGVRADGLDADWLADGQTTLVSPTVQAAALSDTVTDGLSVDNLNANDLSTKLDISDGAAALAADEASLDVAVFDEVPQAVNAAAPSMPDDVDTDLAVLLSASELPKPTGVTAEMGDQRAQLQVFDIDAAGDGLGDEPASDWAQHTASMPLDLAIPKTSQAADDGHLQGAQKMATVSSAFDTQSSVQADDTHATMPSDPPQDALAAYRQAKAKQEASQPNTNQSDGDDGVILSPSQARRVQAKSANTSLKFILPLLLIATAAGGLWYFKFRDTPSETAPVADVQPAAQGAPSRLAITVGQAGELYACQAELGSDALSNEVQALLQKNFANTVCVIDINETVAPQMAGFERLSSVIAILKSVPFASLELVGDVLYINAPNATEITRLVQDLGALMGGSGVTVKAMPPLDAQARIAESVSAANAAMDKLGAAPSDAALARALSLQIMDLSAGTVPEPNRALLARAAEILKAQPNMRLIVAVYSDDMGDASLARAQTQHQAQLIVNELLQLGVGAHQLTALGVGSDFAVSDNHTALGRFKNRRVEFLVYDDAVMQALSQPLPSAMPADELLPNAGLDTEIVSDAGMGEAAQVQGAVMNPPQPTYAVQNGQIVEQSTAEELPAEPNYPPAPAPSVSPPTSNQIPADLLAPIGLDPARGTATQLNN